MKRPLLFGVVVAGVVGAVGFGVHKARAWISSRKHREDTFKHPPEARVSGDGSAVGVLLSAVRAGAFTQPAFVELPYAGLKVTVGVDMLKATDEKLRLLTSWGDTQEICKTLGYVAPTKKLADAIYAAATAKTAFHSLVTKDDPASGGAKMHTLDFARRYNADVDAQLAAAGWDGSTLQSGAEKYWILSPRLAETVKATGKPAAVNYGAWTAEGKPQQSPGAMHDVDYVGDYSQLIRPILRFATDAAGHKVDLLDVFERDEGIDRRFTDLFRRTEAA